MVVVLSMERDRTSEDGDDCFVYSLYLFKLQNITREEGRYEQHDQYEKRP